MYLASSLLKRNFPIDKYLYGSSIEHKSISAKECLVYYVSLLQQIPLYV